MSPPHTDQSFITNEGEGSLLERFKVLIGENTQFFDALVGYFYTSGFYKLYPALEHTEKIRILIGIKTDKTAFKLLQRASEEGSSTFSHAEAKKHFASATATELQNAGVSKEVEEGVNKFIEWLNSGKLEIRAYPSEQIHAKLYIMSFIEEDRDVGRVITGSSNFSGSGLEDNLEFNVELKSPSDYNFARDKFNELWKNSADVKQEYVQSVRNQTWLDPNVKPYELYLKFLYEYFQDYLKVEKEQESRKYLPPGFLDLEYQDIAVRDALHKLQQYGGVFLSDVVGLGKTYIAAMLAQRLDGRNLVIAPPNLLDKDNPGSWRNVFTDFNVAAEYESFGRLERLLERDVGKYRNVFIDESHTFRNESNVTYEQLARVCRGKRVILVTATPHNNEPSDILSQIKLFQKERNSTIPGVSDLKYFFSQLEKRLKKLDRKKDYETYMQIVRQNAEEIRERVLKHIMVRRTRAEVQRYFAEDLEKNNLQFPEVGDPQPVFYQFGKELDEVFNKTIEKITSEFAYARYSPLLYYTGELTQAEELAQQNMNKFMKILLVKRLESSFYAFKQSIDRFIHSYEQFIEEYDNGRVYVSKKHIHKIFELLENDDDEKIQELIDEEKAQVYDASNFTKKFRDHLKRDLEVLREVQNMWQRVNEDPKLDKLFNVLANRKVLKENKLLIFTESRETAEYLAYNLKKKYPEEVLLFTGESGTPVRQQVIKNFDPRTSIPEDEYRILVATEVLSEGVNLHRSNVVINYDLPWNPTRLMQRAGRINRVDAQFDTIHIFNFFPTQQANTEIKLKEAAEAKIQAFIELLGADARLLTEGEEIKSHDLFEQLASRKTVIGEEDAERSELEFLSEIKDVRDNQPELFEKVKRLHKKSRSAKAYDGDSNSLITYFRKGKLDKFYLAGQDGQPQELPFVDAARIFRATPEEPRQTVKDEFYELLGQNKEQFRHDTMDEEVRQGSQGGRDSATRALKILKSKEVTNHPSFTEADEDYRREVIRLIEEGGLPHETLKRLARELEQKYKEKANAREILGTVKAEVSEEFFREMPTGSGAQTQGPREVILSEYLTSGE